VKRTASSTKLVPRRLTGRSTLSVSKKRGGSQGSERSRSRNAQTFGLEEGGKEKKERGLNHFRTARRVSTTPTPETAKRGTGGTNNKDEMEIGGTGLPRGIWRREESVSEMGGRFSLIRQGKKDH